MGFLLGVAMITISSPSMVLNDVRSPRAYAMDFTLPVSATTSIRQSVDLVLRHARAAAGGVLQNLILNAHGLPGSFALGLGLDLNTMAPFADVRGKVVKIWFNGCLVGRIMGPGTARDGDAAALAAYGVTTGDGHRFMSAFARLTGCYVVAPTEMQSSSRTTYSPGLMDSYEGLVLSYDPGGTISWQHRYPSLYGHNPAARTALNPNNE